MLRRPTNVNERQPLIGVDENGGLYKNPNTIAASRAGLIAAAVSVGLVALVALVLAALAFSNSGSKITPVVVPACHIQRVSGVTRYAHTPECTRIDYDPFVEQPYAARLNPEDEAWIAVNPKNPNNMIATSHQGYYVDWLSTPLWYTLDAGLTWSQATVPTNRCSGPSVFNAPDDYFSPSDPMVAFSVDGTAYLTLLSYNFGVSVTTPDEPLKHGVTIWKSSDGGISWDEPQVVSDTSFFVDFMDREHTNVDSSNAKNIFVTWSSYPCFSAFSPCFDESAKLRRSIDGAVTWEGGNSGQVVYYDSDVPGADTLGLPANWGCQIQRMPTGDKALVHICDQYDYSVGSCVPENVVHTVISRSLDDGATWSTPTIATDFFEASCLQLPPASYRNAGDVLRGTGGYTDTAVNGDTGYLYVADSYRDFSTGTAGANVVVMMSKDGGLTWSVPVPVNPANTDSNQFMHAVAVADDGTVAVQYYSDRHNEYADGESYDLDVYVTFFNKDLVRLGESRITPVSFNLLSGNHMSGSAQTFIGDFQALTSYGNEFRGVYTAIETAFNDIKPAQDNGTHWVDTDDRQNVFYYTTNRRDCTTTLEGSGGGAKKRSAIKKQTTQRAKVTTRMTNEQMYEAAMEHWKEERGTLASEIMGPRLASKFGVTPDKR